MTKKIKNWQIVGYLPTGETVYCSPERKYAKGMPSSPAKPVSAPGIGGVEGIALPYLSGTIEIVGVPPVAVPRRSHTT